MPEVLERGDIYFVYRPRVEHKSAAGIEDIQRFFVILSPHGRHIHAQHETMKTAEIFNELHLEPREHPLKPLFEGKWQ